SDYFANLNRPASLPFEEQFRYARVDDWLGRSERWVALSSTYSTRPPASNGNVSRVETKGHFRQTASARSRSCRKRNVATGKRADKSRQLRYWNHAALGLSLDARKMRLQNFAIHRRRHGCGRVGCRRAKPGDRVRR